MNFFKITKEAFVDLYHMVVPAQMETEPDDVSLEADWAEFTEWYKEKHGAEPNSTLRPRTAYGYA